MKFFADGFVKPYIKESGYRRLCEIGASFGENTDKLLEISSTEIDIIDPCIDLRLHEKYAGNKRVRVNKGISLEVLRDISGPFDCILMDGDHNWYTVYNELKTIETRGLLRNGGTIFFHDVGWPYGRRDMYYQPELIPEEFVQPHGKKGLMQGQSELSDASGVNADLYNATHEGGSRNGVLTGIEDFLGENRGKYRFFVVNEEFGLGVLLKTRNPIGNGTFNKYLLKTKIGGFLKKLRNKAGV